MYWSGYTPTMEGGWGSRLLGIVSVAFAVVLATATAATASASAEGAWIVFSADPAAQSIEQLFRIHPAGDGLQQITTGQYSSVAPAFSPNGKRIAFARIGVGILTMNVDGTGVRRLTTNGRDSFPAWSPDGAHVAFIRPYKVEWRVHTMASSGAAERRLPQAPPSGRPSWTPAGLLIPSGGDLLRVDSTTGHVQKYYDAGIDAIWGLNSVTISPNRSLVAFVGARAAEPGDKECGEGPCQRFALYKENIVKKVKKPQRVTNDAGPAAFSPNGTQLVFVAHAGLTLWSLAGGTGTTIPTGDITPTVSAPPTWQR
jgi:dipeptidyl aminopeptidase/acylaminoacyl peptidase